MVAHHRKHGDDSAPQMIQKEQTKCASTVAGHWAPKDPLNIAATIPQLSNWPDAAVADLGMH